MIPALPTPYILWKSLSKDPKTTLRLSSYCVDMYKLVTQRKTCSGQAGLQIASDSSSCLDFSVQLVETTSKAYSLFFENSKRASYEDLGLGTLRSVALTYDVRVWLNNTRIFPSELSRVYQLCTASCLTIVSLREVVRNIGLHLSFVGEAPKSNSEVDAYRLKLESALTGQYLNGRSLTKESAIKHLMATLIKNTLMSTLGFALVAKHLRVMKVPLKFIIALKILSYVSGVVQNYHQLNVSE